MRIAVLVVCLAALSLVAREASCHADTWSPLPYYLVNPYDEMVVGPGVLVVSGSRRVTAGIGYSLSQGEARGYLRLRDESGFARRLGYQLEGFHQVQPVADVVCRYQTGFYEGRTGFSTALVRGLGPGEELLLGYSHEKLWALAAEGSLRPVTDDRVESVSLSYRRDQRDDPLNPRAGLLGEAGITRAARVLGGTRSYLLARGTWARYEPMGARGVKAWRVRAAATTGGLPSQRQIWLASEGVRGYDSYSLNGDLAGVANGELRFPLGGRDQLGFGALGTLQRPSLTLFGDVGLVRLKTRTWKARAGVGAGVRAVFQRESLPTMVMRLEVCRGLDSDGLTRTSFLVGVPELF